MNQAQGREMDRCKILFLAANPQGTSPLALDKEIREIETKIRASEHRDSLELVSKWAVRPDDLLQALNEHRPQVVHFSGHGEADGIVLMGNDDQLKPVGKEALAYLFCTLKDNIRLVLLNACDSRPQAELITQHIDCVIGMNKPIGDAAAIVFAASFYRAIGFGRSVREAFEQGQAALMLEGIPEANTPELMLRPGVDPAEIVLVQPQVSTDKASISRKGPSMKDHSNRSVSIGGNVTGSANVTGNHNVTSLQFTQTTLPPAQNVDIQAELSALRDLLRQLPSADANKIERALEDAEDEAQKSDPDRDEVGAAVARALKYAQQADAFAGTAASLQGHISNVVSWLGDNWHKLLPLVGLKL
ncbi:MAG: CHAT domain-containing protein [Candidatus Paceibacterota bacterium]